jgi:hypothetical protein
MKKLNIICAILFLVLASQFVYSQQIGDLNGIYYQAVAIDENGKEIVGMDIEGKPLYNKEIGVRFSITKGLNGIIQWEETHITNTDKYGLFTLIIGKGTQTGNGLYTKMLDIPWIDADQFLKVEIATKNDDNYKMVSNQQFMSVPYSFYTDDIADNAITTNKILNETIFAEDIGTGSVETSEILNETILAEDIRMGSVETSEILNLTVLNEDIANSTIDLTTKVSGILSVVNGGTGNASLTDNSLLIGNDNGSVQSLGVATDGQIPIGVTGGSPVLGNLTAGTGVTITNTAGVITISSSVSEITSDPAGTFVIGNLPAGQTYTSNAINAFVVNFGDVIIGSVDVSLQGCMLTAYVSQPNVIRISIFNGTGGAVNLGTVNCRVLIVQ